MARRIPAPAPPFDEPAARKWIDHAHARLMPAADDPTAPWAVERLDIARQVAEIRATMTDLRSAVDHVRELLTARGMLHLVDRGA